MNVKQCMAKRKDRGGQIVHSDDVMLDGLTSIVLVEHSSRATTNGEQTNNFFVYVFE